MDPKPTTEFIAALNKLQDRFDFIKSKVMDGSMSIQEAGIKLRSHSIEVGTVACMPFRDGEDESKR